MRSCHVCVLPNPQVTLWFRAGAPPGLRGFSTQKKNVAVRSRYPRR